MVQEQMLHAVTQAMGAAAGGAVNNAATSGRPGARKTLAAMISARETKCDCRACQLLREELEDALGDMLKAAVVEESPSTEPAPAADPRPPQQEVTNAAGNDPPA